MKTLNKNFITTVLVLLCVSPIFAQHDNVIGHISGMVYAGESYDLYRSSLDSFFDYLSGWKYVDYKDKTVTYSYDEIYKKCLEEAERRYGRYYSDLDLEDFEYDIKYVELSDSTYYEAGFSGNELKRKDREKKVYIYSATVVVSQ